MGVLRNAFNLISRILPAQFGLIAEYRIKKLFNRVKFIPYSKKWYENEYHFKVLHLDKVSYKTIMNYYERTGYKRRLFDVLESINLPSDTNYKWLEVGCHFGKTVFWSAEKYSNMTFYMFDFSEVAVKWIEKNNPIPNKTIVWQGDIQDISYNNNKFDDFFDIITCIDVTEHLPLHIYKRALKEIYRVLKPSGRLIIMQGTSTLPEHINIRPEKLYLSDILNSGFKLIRKLPHNHYLFTK